MKLTLYVPDELHRIFKGVHPDAVLSQLLQAAMIHHMECPHTEAKCTACGEIVRRDDV